MQHHPEQQDDEIYMGSASRADLSVFQWESSRLGRITYDSDGRPLNSLRVRPWFIQVAEVTAAIKQESLRDQAGSQAKIRLWQEMVDKRSIFP